MVTGLAMSIAVVEGKHIFGCEMEQVSEGVTKSELCSMGKGGGWGGNH